MLKYLLRKQDSLNPLISLTLFVAIVTTANNCYSQTDSMRKYVLKDFEVSYENEDDVYKFDGVNSLYLTGDTLNVIHHSIHEKLEIPKFGRFSVYKGTLAKQGAIWGGVLGFLIGGSFAAMGTDKKNVGDVILNGLIYGAVLSGIGTLIGVVALVSDRTDFEGLKAEKKVRLLKKYLEENQTRILKK